MKKLLLLFVFIAFSAHLYPSWIKTADYDFLRTGVNIQSLAVTGDSRFAYTSDDSGRVIKWDLNTGDSISMFKVTPLAGLMRNNKWCFISSDAETFSCSYYNIRYNDWYHYIFIYDIDSGILVDSLSVTHLSDFAVPETNELTIVTVDYNSAAKKLFYGLNVHRRQEYMYKDDDNVGMINCLVKENDKWRTIFYSPRSLRSFDNNFDNGIAFIDTFESFSSRVSPHEDKYTYRFTKISYLANSITGNLQIINNFAYADGKRAGADYDITSCILIDSILLNNNKNVLFKYNTNDISLLRANTLKEYPNTYIYLARSLNKDYFFILDGNRLNIHDFSSFIRKRIIEVDPADRINIVRNTPDSSKIILTDYRGGLYRIYSDSIFRLYANFNTNDTIYTVADTIQFEDLSIGKPDFYSWDFGDGQTSAESNPKHNYSDTGVYTVRLVIGKGTETDTIIKTNYITVIPKLDVTFSYMVNVDYPTKILYTNTTIGDYDSLL